MDWEVLGWYYGGWFNEGHFGSYLLDAGGVVDGERRLHL